MLHLENALRKPTDQTTHNRFSFFWQQHNHPEYPYTNKTPDILLDINPGESSTECPNNEQTTKSITCNSLTPPCHSHNDVNAALEDNCKVIRYVLEKQQTPSKHNALLAVLTRRSSLLPENNPRIEPATPNPGNSDIPSDSDETQLETAETTEHSPIAATPALFIDTSRQTTTATSTNPLQRFSQAVGQILSPKTPSLDSQQQNQSPATENVQNVNQTSKTNAPLTDDPPSRSNTRQENHPTFAYPPIHETFLDDDDPDNDNDNDEDEPPQIPLASPDALTSSTRTDFTYPPIEDLTRTLLKYAKTANLRKLSYPTDLLSRRRQFNAFMDNLRIVCNISPWTRQVFDLWPKQISYSHPCIGTAIYNLIFTNISDPCQKHIIDCPPDARTAILTLRRHCAPLTQDHVERTRETFCSIKQGHQEVATSYLNRIRTLTRDCYHAGIPKTDAEIIKRAIRGGSNHHFYAASYQRFDADIRRAELNDEELPPFAELESHLLNIDESRGLTLPSQNQRNYNQHANSARQSFSNHTFQPRQGTTRVFTPRQQQAFSSTMRPYTSNNSRPPHRPNIRQNNPAPAHPRQNNNNDRRTATHQPRTSQQQNRGARPPFRPISSNNTNQRRPPNQNNHGARRNPSASNTANIVCNNCGRLGHYANRCITANRRPQSSNNNRGGPPNRNTNNENAAPSNQRAYFITDSAPPKSHVFHHQACMALSTCQNNITGPQTVTSWPDSNTPQMEINRALLSNDFLPTAPQAPPNTGSTELFPDDPLSTHQRFGPPILDNWLPDSGATCHYTPVFSDLRDVEACHIPVSLADGTTKISTFKGTTDCYFTTDEGQRSILGLTDVYYIEGLSHRLLSLTAISATQNFTVIIRNRATTIQFPNDSKYTWPLLLHELPTQQAFSTMSQPENGTPTETTFSPAFEQHVDTSQPENSRPTSSLPLETVSRRLAHRNFRNLMSGSLHHAWNDHTLSPAIDKNTWPIRMSISQKHARSKIPLRQGSEPFHQLHLDLMRNPFRFGLTTATNYSAYLFIVTTPGKLTGWIGLPTESTASIITALKSWLTQTELLGRTKSVRFIRTDAGSAFTSAKFITACNDLGIKLEAAAPEHQEMNGICEAKWREIHNTANILLNTARLGGAFFHHAHAYAIHIVNSCPAKNVTDQDGNPTTPFQYSYGRKPSLANFRVFGCPVYFKRYEPTFRNKLITY